MGTLTAGALPCDAVADCAHRALTAALARWKAWHPWHLHPDCREYPSLAPQPWCAQAPLRAGTALWHSPRHPPGPKPKVPGVQRWQRRPMTLGLHRHWPPWGSHSALSEPWGSQRQAVGRERAEHQPPRSRGWGTGRGMGCGAQDGAQDEVRSHTHAVPRRAGWPRGCAGGWSRAQPQVRAQQRGRAGHSGTAQRSAGAPWSWGHPR